MPITSADASFVSGTSKTILMTAQPMQRLHASARTQPSRNVGRIVDFLLLSLVKEKGTALWLEPIGHEGSQDAHRVTVERNSCEIMSTVLGEGLGDAALARLALLAGLDLLLPTVQNGRFSARLGDTDLDLLVAIRPTGRGLSGEVLVLNTLAQDIDAGSATLSHGGVYPEILEQGSTVGPYRIERTLGRGGMGMVYRVEHVHLGKCFAMKVLHTDVLAADPDAARRFVREARAAARVQHSGIVDVSDFGSFSDGRHYIVMELLDGQCLHDVIHTHGALEPLRALQLMRDVASALAAAHAAGIVHRDVSPSNIFINTVQGIETVKIVDFGAASLVDADLGEVADGPPGMVIGTPHYMAPEQVQSLPTDSRSDMYSFGAVLYELVSGRVPFDGDTAVEIVIKHIRETPPPLDTDSDQPVPAPLWQVIERLMAKKPEDRYPTTDAVIADLDRVMALLQRKGWRRWLAL